MTTHTKNFISSSQIRAARALLNWSQEDLSGASGLSVAIIRKLELGHISPRAETARSIKHAFEEAGLEFVTPDGVRRRPEEISVYQGHEGAIAFFNNVYETARHKGGEIILVCDSERPFADALGYYESIYIEKMTTLKSKMHMKCLVTEDDSFLPCSAYSEYRRLSKGYVDSVPFYVYDDKYAIFVFDADPSPKITVLQSRVTADAFRRQFKSMWDKATPLNTSSGKAISAKKEKMRK